MARLILRPTSDISKSNFTPTPTTITEVYPTINEVTPDDATTYSTASAAAATFSVGLTHLNNEQIRRIRYINSITVYIRCYTSGTSGSVRYGVNVPTVSTIDQALTTAYADYSYVAVVNTTPSQFDLNSLNLYCYVISCGTVDPNSKILAAFFVTQMYVVVDYREKKIKMYVRVGDIWKEVQQVYIKINSAWIEADGVYSKTETWKSG